uniref:hypothetical protein n=1 Tax=Alistipes putredinis TaxID=28117 RepID=UPI003FD8C320
MTIEDLKGVKLSPATRGYLSIYIKLTDLYEDAYDASRMEFGDNEADDINEDFYRSLMKAQDEIMKLCNQSITGKLQLLRNHTEI